jgi:hypothetical protein
MFGRETRMLLRHDLEQGTSKSALTLPVLSTKRRMASAANASAGRDLLRPRRRVTD